MKGLVLFLAIAMALLLASPSFWWIVQAETGAAPSLIVEADGAERESFIGPRSPWPEWALLPENAALTPRAYYAAAPGHPATGFGDVSFAATSEQTTISLTRALGDANWSVEAVRYRLAEPSVPPRYFTVCTITARRARGESEVTVQYAFQLTPARRGARVHWIEGSPPSSWPIAATLPDWTEPRQGCF